MISFIIIMLIALWGIKVDSFIKSIKITNARWSSDPAPQEYGIQSKEGKMIAY